jgi:Uma2 family endonuclease
VPELVIEVKSPSHTVRQLRELVPICLNEGSQEVWIVDSIRKSVTVFRGDGIPAVFASCASLSLAVFDGGELPVDEIFA